MDSSSLTNLHDNPIGTEIHEHEQLDQRNSHDHSSPVPPPSNGREHGYAPLNDPFEDLEVSSDADYPHNPRSDAPSLRTVRSYNHRESRKFLLWTGLNRLGATILFCIVICLSLRGFEGFQDAHPRVLSKSQVQSFNAIMLGLSLGLGLNLASSLKHYGLILRWSILTRRYVSLQVFDLILSCENLSKVFKLMILSIPGIDRIPVPQLPTSLRGSPSLKNLPSLKNFLAGARKDGSRYTWLICLAWLLINIGAQILVATLSIFWPVDPSDTMPLLTQGDVSVANLSTWGPEVRFSRQFSTANAYGVAGSQYIVSNLTKPPTAEDGIVIYYKGGNYQYTFLNRNPNTPHLDFIHSSRTVQASTVCQQYSFGSSDGTPVHGVVEGSFDGWKTSDKIPMLHSVKGTISWTAMTESTCGSRCTNLVVYQRADNKTIAQNAMFQCNSTIDPINSNPNEFSSIKDEDKPQIYSTDDFARIAAGAIAWTGYTEFEHDELQCRVYLAGLPFSPYQVVDVPKVEALISRFSIGAIAAFDDHGSRITLVNQHNRPVQGQRLNVDWPRILIILSWICFLQLLALIALLAFANKSIIRDESFFSLALLLSPVINRISKEEGTNLSGEEIYFHPNLVGQRIKYDYRKIQKGLKKVDVVFEQDRLPGVPEKVRRTWTDGNYI